MGGLPAWVAAPQPLQLARPLRLEIETARSVMKITFSTLTGAGARTRDDRDMGLVAPCSASNCLSGGLSPRVLLIGTRSWRAIPQTPLCGLSSAVELVELPNKGNKSQPRVTCSVLEINACGFVRRVHRDLVHALVKNDGSASWGRPVRARPFGSSCLTQKHRRAREERAMYVSVCTATPPVRETGPTPS